MLNMYVCAIVKIICHFQSPACNGAEISEYRLDWGQVEGSMHVIYTGPCQSYEVKGLTPATTYYCRVQVRKAFYYVLLNK